MCWYSAKNLSIYCCFNFSSILHHWSIKQVNGLQIHFLIENTISVIKSLAFSGITYVYVHTTLIFQEITVASTTFIWFFFLNTSYDKSFISKTENQPILCCYYAFFPLNTYFYVIQWYISHWWGYNNTNQIHNFQHLCLLVQHWIL